MRRFFSRTFEILVFQNSIAGNNFKQPCTCQWPLMKLRRTQLNLDQKSQHTNCQRQLCVEPVISTLDIAWGESGLSYP